MSVKGAADQLQATPETPLDSGNQWKLTGKLCDVWIALDGPKKQDPRCSESEMSDSL